MRKSNFLNKSFSSVGTCSPHFQKKHIVTLLIYLLCMLIQPLTCYASDTVEMLEQQYEQDDFYTELYNIISPDVPVDNDTDTVNELRSINIRLDELQSTSKDLLEETKDLVECLDLVNGHLSLILGSITLVIIAIIFLGICRWLYKYLKF